MNFKVATLAAAVKPFRAAPLRSMDLPRPQLLILADAPDALRVLFGISLLERLLRMAQRLGFRDALIMSRSRDEIAAHLAKPSWARPQVALTFRALCNRPVQVADVTTGAERTLVVSAGFYYDARLLKSLADQTSPALLVNSHPPPQN